MVREANEELNIKPDFSTKFGDKPFFITINITSGHNQHTDVSLWYIVNADSTKSLNFNTEEINSCKWLTLDQVLATDITQLDRHMHRCVNKIIQFI